MSKALAVTPQVASADYHAAAIKTDGSLWAWGSNDYGQLGDGTTTQRLSPVLIGNGYSSIAIGPSHSLAIKADGSLWAWGNNVNGQLGDGTQTNQAQLNAGTQTNQVIPKQIGAGYSAVSTGFTFSVGIKNDGSLWTWGSTSETVGSAIQTVHLLPIQIGSGFTAVSAGNYHALGLKADGTLWAWGSNDTGQLGDGTRINSAIPVQVGTGYQAIAAGEYYSVALKTDGSLWEWGDNIHGELGNGTNNPRNAPILVGTGYSAIAVASYQVTALKTDGSLWAWGQNAGGQLGDGTIIDRYKPELIGAGFTLLHTSGGNAYTLAVKADGSVWGWGWNGLGLLGDGTTVDKLTPEATGFNLNAGTPFTAQAAAVGPLTQQSLSVTLTPATSDVGQIGAVFVAAVVPKGSIYVLTPTTGWQAYDPSNPEAYSIGSLQQTSVNLLTKTNMTPLVGTALYLGYGVGNSALSSLGNMLKAGSLKTVYTIQ